MRLTKGWRTTGVTAVLMLAAMSVTGSASFAQFVSPEVHPDGRITFRAHAPNADSVIVKGIEGQGRASMTQGRNGVWSTTVGPLAPELYSYVFEIDGADVIDRHNRSLKKWFVLESLVEVPGNPPLVHEKQPVRHGTVSHHIYSSQSAGIDRGVYVYTPPGYDAARERGYPMLLLLHGFGDDESAWLDVGRANFIADNLIHEDEMTPAVIVMPYGHPEPVERSFSDDYRRRNEVKMERDVLEDLIPFVARHYNVAPDRNDHAIAGLSMGGGHSIRIGLRNLDRFAWIGAFSAAAPTRNLGDKFGALAEDVDATNERISLLWIACGRDDFLLQDNETFRNWLDEQSIEHVYELTEGAHTWFVWRRYLRAFLGSIFSEP